MRLLSILIPTIPERAHLLNPLLVELERQITEFKSFHSSIGSVDVIINDEKRYLAGGPSIGIKRQKLLDSATGKYLLYLDDDENIAPNYVETLMRLCAQDKDICTFKSIAKLDNYWMVVDMSLDNSNEQGNPEGIKRKPWHICPVRSYFAKLHSFEDISYGEDFSWMRQVLQHCQSEAKSSYILHQYNHSTKFSEADKIMNHV